MHRVCAQMNSVCTVCLIAFMSTKFKIMLSDNLEKWNSRSKSFEKNTRVVLEEYKGNNKKQAQTKIDNRTAHGEKRNFCGLRNCKNSLIERSTTQKLKIRPKYWRKETENESQSKRTRKILK